LSQSNVDHLLQKYLLGQCTAEEEKRVQEWYETLIRDSNLHLSDAQKAQIETRLWENIKTRVQPASEPAPAARVINMRLRRRVMMAAAGVLLLMMAGVAIYYSQHAQPAKQIVFLPPQQPLDSVMNTTTAQKEYALADGSRITLQPGATVYYPAVFSGPTRDVYLTGSAFFNVYHNPQKHFKVHLHSGLTTEVLGTSFNITQNQPAATIEVAVVTGRVLVYKQQEQQHNTTFDSTSSVLLTGNKKVTYNAASSQFITGIVDNPLPLKKTATPHSANETTVNPTFIFDETPLSTVLQTLGDAYGIIIIPENEQIGNYHFRGNISQYGLFTQLDIICKSTQTTYEINGTQIIVKENK
jgi:ferric-dicitrate binding protein FerR (iron transport regulator)